MNVKDIQFILDKMDDKMLRHANNTACLCYGLGKMIDCPGEELEALWFAGLLHQCGELVILNKLKTPIDISFEDTFDIFNRKDKLEHYTL